ncbi:PilX N-terminal domain-containing pilus assembly protein [Billgrantia sp. LNSP4103-1]|uniref:PilX N-terminal domain-containing pilus assembly protein n=1 Tax=Billgrantia sp. LNSP4103-1 TaxID=3410266 RepID=UPI00403F671E
MAGIRQKQQGAALVMVLAMLSMTLMLGLSSMSGSLVNERLAGNYRASVLAQNEAEAGLFTFNDELRAAVTALNEGQLPVPPVFASGNVSNFYSRLRDAANLDSAEEIEAALASAFSGPWQTGNLNDGGRYRWRLRPPTPEEEALLAGQVGIRIESEGFYGSANDQEAAKRSLSALMLLPELPTGGRRGLTSCESILVKGSGMIDSYDSRLGSYGGSNSRRSNIDVATQTADSNVFVTGSSPIYGNVASSGGVLAEGSGEIHGRVRAYEDIKLKGGGVNVYGSTSGMKDIIFESSATVHGNVHAGHLLHFKNHSAGVNGNARSPLVLSDNRSPDDHVSGELVIGSAPPDEESFGFKPKTNKEDCIVHGRYTSFLPYLSSSSGEHLGALDFGGGSRTVTLGLDGLRDPSSAPPICRCSTRRGAPCRSCQ